MKFLVALSLSLSLAGQQAAALDPIRSELRSIIDSFDKDVAKSSKSSRTVPAKLRRHAQDVNEESITQVIGSISNATLEADSVTQCEVDLAACTQVAADTINPSLIVGVLSAVLDPTGGVLTQAVLGLVTSFASGQGIDVATLVTVGVLLLTETQIAQLLGSLLQGGNVRSVLITIVQNILARGGFGTGGSNADGTAKEGINTDVDNGGTIITFLTVLQRLTDAESNLNALITAVVSTLTMGDTKAVLTVIRIVVTLLSEIIDLPGGGGLGQDPSNDDDEVSSGDDSLNNGKNKKTNNKKSSTRRLESNQREGERRLKGERCGQAKRRETASTRPARRQRHRHLQLSEDSKLDILSLLRADGEVLAIPHGSHTHQVSIRDELSTVALIEVSNLFALLRSMVEPLRDNRAAQLWNAAVSELDFSADKKDSGSSGGSSSNNGKNGKAPKGQPQDDPDDNEPGRLASLIQKLAQLLTADLVVSIITALTQLLTQTTEQLATTDSASITVDGPFSYLGGLIGLASRSLQQDDAATTGSDRDFFVPGLVQLVASLAMYQGTYDYLDGHYPQFANTTQPNMAASVPQIEAAMHAILVDVSHVMDLQAQQVVAAAGSTSSGTAASATAAPSAGGSNVAVTDDGIATMGDDINCNLELLACKTTTSVFTGASL